MNGQGNKVSKIATNPVLYMLAAGIIGAFANDVPADIMPYAKDLVAALTFVAGLLMDPSRMKTLVGAPPATEVPKT